MSLEPLFRKRRLPHWDVPGATYFVTACLAGSIPAKGALSLESYRRSLDERPRPGDLTEPEWETQKHKLIFARFDRLIDMDPAVRHLADARLANEVRYSLYHFASERYDVYAYVVMPSHLHWVFRPREAWVASFNPDRQGRRPRERIMHTLKLRTSRACNGILGTEGTFWQDESYDHCVRDADELTRIIEYVETNPVKTGHVALAEQWQFSSARDRQDWDVDYGEPLVRPSVSGADR